MLKVRIRLTKLDLGTQNSSDFLRVRAKKYNLRNSKIGSSMTIDPKKPPLRSNSDLDINVQLHEFKIPKFHRNFFLSLIFCGLQLKAVSSTTWWINMFQMSFK